FRTKQLSLRRGFLALIVSFAAGCLLFEASSLHSSADCVPKWWQIGPAPVNINPPDGTNGQGPDAGMVRDIVIDPRGPTDQTIFVATDSGGVWKTTDGGNTWSPKTDFLPTLCMGSIALDPANPSIVYAGTGNDQNQGFFRGAGIYKSLNGGEAWTVLGANIFTNVAITRIVLPANNVLLVASWTGVYRSIDGGVHFGSNSPQFDNNQPIIAGFVEDLDLDTASTNTVYASLAFGGGVFKSTDSGATFPAAGNLFTASNGSPLAAGFAYVTFAQSTQPNNQTMYVNVALNSGGAGLYRSTDSGANWTRITT